MKRQYLMTTVKGDKVYKGDLVTNRWWFLANIKAEFDPENNHHRAVYEEARLRKSWVRLFKREEDWSEHVREKFDI